jgi:predicted phosphodiesterase
MPRTAKIVRPSKASLWFGFPDIHFPDQDPEALAIAEAAHRALNPDYSIFLGDVLDCEIFKSHARKTIAEVQTYDYKELELDPCNRMLDRIQKSTKKKTFFLEGNHEQRIERWAVNNGRVGESIYPLISPKETIAKGRKNFEMIPYEVPTGSRMGYVQIAPNNTKMTTGGLVAVHGWSFAKHTASVHLEKSRSQSVLFGHVHRSQTVVSRDPWTGKIIKSFCPGTLSHLQPIYAHGGSPSDWSHGFVIIYVGQHSWTEYCISIVNGRCVLPDGREIKLV